MWCASSCHPHAAFVPRACCSSSIFHCPLNKHTSGQFLLSNGRPHLLRPHTDPSRPPRFAALAGGGSVAMVMAAAARHHRSRARGLPKCCRPQPKINRNVTKFQKNVSSSARVCWSAAAGKDGRWVSPVVSGYTFFLRAFSVACSCSKIARVVATLRTCGLRMRRRPVCAISLGVGVPPPRQSSWARVVAWTAAHMAINSSGRGALMLASALMLCSSRVAMTCSPRTASRRRGLRGPQKYH